MVMRTANKMAGMSRASRTSPNSGKGVGFNKNRSDGMGQKSRTAAVFAATHTGPYLGKRSV